MNVPLEGQRWGCWPDPSLVKLGPPVRAGCGDGFVYGLPSFDSIKEVGRLIISLLNL